jgi:hypothetical protein
MHGWEINGNFSVEVVKYASTLELKMESECYAVGQLHPVSECLAHMM